MDILMLLVEDSLLGNNLVAAGLKPEITTSVEAGFDLDLNKYLASIGMTYYKSNTVDQTIPVQVPSSTGFSTLLTNVGEVENEELKLIFGLRLLKPLMDLVFLCKPLIR